MTMDSASFSLFRFQLVPIARDQQVPLFDEEMGPDDLIRRKNEMFGEVLENLPRISSARHELVQKDIFLSEKWAYFKLAARHPLKRQQPNFQTETLDDWPSVTVIVCNDPDIQAIAISKNKRAFSEPEIVAHLLRACLDRHLANRGLALHIEPQFNRNQFWKLVDQYEGKITSVKFECVTPNMSRISRTVSDELRELGKV